MHHALIACSRCVLRVACGDVLGHSSTVTVKGVSKAETTFGAKYPDAPSREGEPGPDSYGLVEKPKKLLSPSMKFGVRVEGTCFQCIAAR